MRRPASISMATGAARLWTGAYTLGLGADDREQRRAEIESDLWEHHRDRGSEPTSRFAVTLEVLSRMVRGVPADLMWRLNLEGPKMQISIPFERVSGALLIALVALFMITGGISGYDTSQDAFGDELRRLADLNGTADFANAAVRLATGLGLIGAAAGFYLALHPRSPALTTFAAFGLVTAGVLALVAGAMQLALVDLAEQYVRSDGAEASQVLVTARGMALLVQGTVGAAFFTLIASTWVLAALAGRERLVARWMIALPCVSAALLIASGVASVMSDSDQVPWILLSAGWVVSMLWLLIAGVSLLFASPTNRTPSPSAAQPEAA